MMAGAGVGGVGGGGMLRTRRRDISVKPNRKLDRKSSRGMIYENEELRLRTININAEVEQGQNDIKKLRRENEQLRREIWSLRDEYDKLEEILKRQKNRGESEEYEDRSEEDDESQSDFSCEEGEEDEEEREDNEKTEDLNREEQLENAENQKISSEKMSSSLHRLHVEFDDLSVVDEEEEPKKERKEATSSPEDGQKNDGDAAATAAAAAAAVAWYPPPPIHGLRQLHDNIPFYPATYEPAASGFGGTSYYTEYPFPNTVDLMLPTLLASPCSGLQSDPLAPLAGLDDGQVADPMLPQIHVPPVGWQSNVTIAQNQSLPSFYTSTKIAPVPSTTWITGKSQSEHQKMTPSVGNVFSFPKRANAIARQPAKLQDKSAVQDLLTYFSSREEAVGRHAWDFVADSVDKKNTSDERETRDPQVQSTKEEAATSPEKPKHFFAPFKLKRQEEESPTTSHFGTGTSSSSGKTVSTVISRTNPFLGQKGSADIYVNGAIPCDDENRDNSRTYLSTDNLLISDGRGNQLTKSLSCQDLPSESQSAAQLKLSQVESQTLARSDNTLDSITGGSRPYKSHLNVTLKVPRIERAPSPETPEVPNLPSIDYRLFRNPFLRTFDKMGRGYQAEPNPPPPATSPLSVQVNDDAYRYPVSTYDRGVHLNERFHAAAHLADQTRLLMPNDQVMGGKQDIQVTSFEKPSPCTLIPSAAPYDLTALRRLNRCAQNLYQNIPYAPRGIERPGQFYPQTGGIMYYDNAVVKVPAQTQTSIDGDSHHEDERHDEETAGAPGSPSAQKRKKAARKAKNPASPVAQGRPKKQVSTTSTDTLDSPEKTTRKKSKRPGGIAAENPRDKNESRSSSSGQDSPRKDQTRRVSYVNPKRRSSQTSLKTSRSGSADPSRLTDGVAPHSEGTNSVSSREIAGGKARKNSTSSGSVPWCACWGNGCV